MCYEYGSLPTGVTHDGVNLKRTFVRIEISTGAPDGAPNGADYIVGAPVRLEGADCLIDFRLGNDGTAVARGQSQCGEVLITWPRLPNSAPNKAISESQSHDAFHRVEISAYAVSATHCLNRQF